MEGSHEGWPEELDADEAARFEAELRGLVEHEALQHRIAQELDRQGAMHVWQPGDETHSAESGREMAQTIIRQNPGISNEEVALRVVRRQLAEMSVVSELTHVLRHRELGLGVAEEARLKKIIQAGVEYRGLEAGWAKTVDGLLEGESLDTNQPADRLLVAEVAFSLQQHAPGTLSAQVQEIFGTATDDLGWRRWDVVGRAYAMIHQARANGNLVPMARQLLDEYQNGGQITVLEHDALLALLPAGENSGL